MTEAEQARNEWISERAAILWVENGWGYPLAVREATRMYEEDMARRASETAQERAQT